MGWDPSVPPAKLCRFLRHIQAAAYSIGSRLVLVRNLRSQLLRKIDSTHGHNACSPRVRRAETAGSEAERPFITGEGPTADPTTTTEVIGGRYARSLPQELPQDDGGCWPRRRRGDRLSCRATGPELRHGQ